VSEQVKPTRGWFLAKRNLAPTETPSGIVIPQSAVRRANDVQVGAKQSVTVVAMHSQDEFYTSYDWDDASESEKTVQVDVSGFHPGDEVFVLAKDDNLIPVVTDFYGRVEVKEGVQVPDFYLFRVDAVAGVIPQKVSE
jgi:hypothetical protein